MILGAGRETKEDVLDLSAGIVLEKKAVSYTHLDVYKRQNISLFYN